MHIQTQTLPTGYTGVTQRNRLIETFLYSATAYSRGTKVDKMLTLAPERYTAGFCMVAKVILWCI